MINQLTKKKILIKTNSIVLINCFKVIKLKQYIELN